MVYTIASILIGLIFKWFSFRIFKSASGAWADHGVEFFIHPQCRPLRPLGSRNSSGRIAPVYPEV